MTYERKRPAAIGFGRSKKSLVSRPAAVPATIENRLEAKAEVGDTKVYSGPSLDEMSREQRHKLLYGN